MEASYLPKVEGLNKKEETGHSLWFDSALGDTIMRQNAYEERLLLRKTEVIEREKQHALEKLNFYQNQFLVRYLPVLGRQRDLREASLENSFVRAMSQEDKRTVKQRPSSYPAKAKSKSAKSRLSSAAEKLGNMKRIASSAELRFPALRENMDDILNGYRTPRLPAKSASPPKTYFGKNTSFPSAITDIRQTQSGEASRVSFSDYSESANQMQRWKSNGGDSSVGKDPIVASTIASPSHSFCPNPSHNNLNQTFKKDNFDSRKVNFLAKVRNGQDCEAGIATDPLKRCMNANFGNVVPFRLGSDVYLLSDVKMRQRQDAQRIRVMRTVVLAYDAVWNERLKKINKV